ncbi:MAG: APC family permease [Gemmatimonadales bacterium]
MSQTTRTIGLWGAVFTLVGYVVGASIFILPGQLAASAGPGVVVSYLLAGAVAAISCLVGAVLGSAVPVSGCVNVAAARVVAPLAGFMGTWVILVAVIVGISLVAFGLADYVAYFLPDADRRVVAVVAVAACVALNLTTVRLAVSVQAAMTLGFLAVMVVFGLAGVMNARPELLQPVFPNGGGAVLSGAVLAFFSYTGVTVITEIGGEIREPDRTIPRAMLFSFLVVLSAYLLVAAAIPAGLRWLSVADPAAPVARAAEVFLPAWVGGAIAIAAVLASVTSINGMLLIHSRDLLAMARAEVFPAGLGARNQAGVPARAILLIGGLALVSVLFGGTIRQYAMVAVMSVMLWQISMGVTLLGLPRRLPEAWGRAGFRLAPAARVAAAVGLILTSAAFFLLGVLDNLAVSAGYLVVVAVGTAYYYGRRTQLRRSGIALDRILREGVEGEG